VRNFIIVAVLVFLAGCKKSEQTQAPAPAPARPPAQTTDQGTQNTAAAKKEPRKAVFPLDQEQFKAGITGLTREQVLAKYGQPDETVNLPGGVGWDGPLLVYWGPFTTADGKQVAKAQVYFRRSGDLSVVAQVGFVNK